MIRMNVGSAPEMDRRVAVPALVRMMETGPVMMGGSTHVLMSALTGLIAVIAGSGHKVIWTRLSVGAAALRLVTEYVRMVVLAP